VPKDAPSDPRPVLIFLHGNGGNAKGAMRGFMHRNKTLSATCILVFAQGYKESWNIVSERAQSDDLGFIEEIVTKLGTFDNVQKETFTILGSSNGAALANQIAIETKLPQIKNYVCMVSHLNGYQHDGKHFKAKGVDNNYTANAHPMTGKRILNISGDSDDLVPYKGGPSKGIPAKDGRLPFVDAEESIFLWAKHFGHTGEKLTEPTSIKGQLEAFSYLDGDVVHYKAVGSRHNAGGALTEKLLLEFLNHDQASR
jgi:poly(3-hydroxybutyrate) depolymerase